MDDSKCARPPDSGMTWMVVPIPLGVDDLRLRLPCGDPAVLTVIDHGCRDIHRVDLCAAQRGVGGLSDIVISAGTTVTSRNASDVRLVTIHPSVMVIQILAPPVAALWEVHPGAPLHPVDIYSPT